MRGLFEIEPISPILLRKYEYCASLGIGVVLVE